MATGPLSADEERTWRRYRRMRTLLDLAIARELAAAGLSEADHDVLAALDGADGSRARARDLAAELLWSTSRLAHHVGRMESRGLVRRIAVKDDARGATVVLSAAGRRRLRAAEAAYADAVRANLLDLLNPTELRTLGRIATRVVGRLE